MLKESERVEQILDEIARIKVECRSLSTCLFEQSDKSLPLKSEESMKVKESIFEFVLSLQQLSHMLEVWRSNNSVLMTEA